MIDFENAPEVKISLFGKICNHKEWLFWIGNHSVKIERCIKYMDNARIVDALHAKYDNSSDALNAAIIIITSVFPVFNGGDEIRILVDYGFREAGKIKELLDQLSSKLKGRMYHDEPRCNLRVTIYNAPWLPNGW
jgi:hypothetical protein